MQKVKYLGTNSSYFHNISFWTYVLEHGRSNGAMTLGFQGHLIARKNIQRKRTHLHSKYFLNNPSLMFNNYFDSVFHFYQCNVSNERMVVMANDAIFILQNGSEYSDNSTQ